MNEVPPPPDELAALRRRAYGPDADIGADPIAQARLAELEQEYARRGRADAAVGPSIGDAASGAVGPSSAPAVGLISSATEESGDRTDDSTSGRGRLRRATPIIAVGATACAVIALVVLGLDRLNQPQPVARLVALDEIPRGTALPMVDPAELQSWGVTDPDFVPYEEYGALDVWSTTAARGRQCLAVSIGGEVYGFHCTAPNIDTFVDILGLNSWMPEAPGGGRIPSESTIRFVLHDDVVDVYLGPIRTIVG